MGSRRSTRVMALLNLPFKRRAGENTPTTSPNGQHPGWIAFALESTGTVQDWSLEVFVVCAEL